MGAVQKKEEFFGFQPGDKILLVEDHPLVMASVKNTLASDYNMVEFLEAKNETEAIQLASRYEIRLAVFDVFLNGVKTFETIRQIRMRYPQMRSMIFSGSVSAEIITAGKDLGVNGFVCKTSSPDEFLNVVNEIMYGKTAMCQIFEKAAKLHSAVDDEYSTLTRREKEILDYTLQGMTLREIANVARISRTTVKKHRQHILQKLNFANSAKLVAYSKQIKIEN